VIQVLRAEAVYLLLSAVDESQDKIEDEVWRERLDKSDDNVAP
jgi:hypothetical protein